MRPRLPRRPAGPRARPGAVAALAAAAGLLLASCNSVPQELIAAEALECPSGSACYDPPSPSGPGGTLVVEGGEFFFEIIENQAVEGPVQVTFRNVGTSEHNITIDEAYGDDDVVPAEGAVPGGQTAEGVLELFGGTYTFYCSIPGHRQAGMVGTLTVALPGEAITSPIPTEAPGTPIVTEGGEPGEGGPAAPATEPTPEEEGGPPDVPQQTSSP